MKISSKMLADASEAAPNVPIETVRSILEAALLPNVALPPFPWKIQIRPGHGQRPTHAVDIVGSNGEDVCFWITTDADHFECIQKRAQFILEAVAAFRSQEIFGTSAPRNEKTAPTRLGWATKKPRPVKVRDFSFFNYLSAKRDTYSANSATHLTIPKIQLGMCFSGAGVR